jgi:CheY-like chemotaxis protein
MSASEHGEPRPCLLIVDDDAELRESAADGLTDAGFEPLVAVDGHEALALLRGPKRPRLVLLDLMMPAMNGWEFREALRAEPALGRVPILVITAARNLGLHPIDADAILFKPFGLGRLVGQVQELMGEGDVDDRGTRGRAGWGARSG